MSVRHASGAQRRPRGSGGTERTTDHVRFHWPPHLAALLGKIPDRAVALRARVSLKTVAAERRRRRIPAAAPRRQVKWTPRMIALLGADSDVAVAAELGLTHSSVRWKRLRLGIPPYRLAFGRRQGYLWTPRALSLVGTATDADVARRLGISRDQVAYQRLKQGIAPYVPGPRRIAWSREIIRFLGKHPDTEVARRFGIGGAAIAAKRRQLGIPAHRDVRMLRRTPALARLLLLPNRELAQQAGINLKTVNALRREYGIPAPPRTDWTPKLLARLGKQRDAAIAADLGVHPLTVARTRLALGIPPLPSPGAPARYWPRQLLARLGKQPDAAIAARLGVHPDTVRRKRLALGIPAPPRRPRKERGRRSEPSAARPRSGRRRR